MGKRYHPALEWLYRIEHPTLRACLSTPEEESAATKQENDDDDDQQRLVIHAWMLLLPQSPWLFQSAQPIRPESETAKDRLGLPTGQLPRLLTPILTPTSVDWGWSWRCAADSDLQICSAKGKGGIKWTPPPGIRNQQVVGRGFSRDQRAGRLMIPASFRFHIFAHPVGALNPCDTHHILLQPSVRVAVRASRSARCDPRGAVAQSVHQVSGLDSHFHESPLTRRLYTGLHTQLSRWWAQLVGAPRIHPRKH